SSLKRKLISRCDWSCAAGRTALWERFVGSSIHLEGIYMNTTLAFTLIVASTHVFGNTFGLLQSSSLTLDTQPTRHDRTASNTEEMRLAPSKVLNDHSSEVLALAFSHDGKWLATTDAKEWIILWDTQGYRRVQKIKNRMGAATGVCFVCEAT